MVRMCCLRPREELVDEGVVCGTDGRNRVASPGEDLSFRVDLLGENVADCLEDRRVPAGDDELREWRGRELRAWDLGLPGWSLARCKPGAVLQPVRQFVWGLMSGVQSGAERAKELGRRNRACARIQLWPAGRSPHRMNGRPDARRCRAVRRPTAPRARSPRAPAVDSRRTQGGLASPGSIAVPALADTANCAQRRRCFRGPARRPAPTPTARRQGPRQSIAQWPPAHRRGPLAALHFGSWPGAHSASPHAESAVRS
jgi:hypothetical protein